MEFRMLALDAYDDLNRSDGFYAEDMKKCAQETGNEEIRKVDLPRLLDSEFAIIFVLPNGDKVRKFPFADKASLKMSLKAFNKNSDKLPEEAKRIIAHRLYRAAERYEIETSDLIKKIVSSTTSIGHVYPLSGDMMAALLHFGPTEEDVEKDGAFAITRDIYGKPMQKFAIDTKAQWERQVKNFEKKAHSWLVSYSVQMSKNLKKRASELGIDIDPDSKIHQFSGEELSKSAHLNIDRRVHKLEERGNEDGAWEYVELRSKIGSVSPSQLAVTAEELDRKHRLHFYWSSRAGSTAGLFHHPADAFLAKSEKRASSLDIDGLIVDLGKLSDILENNPDLLAAHLDEDTLERLEDSPEETLKTMPAPQREIVLDVLRRVS